MTNNNKLSVAFAGRGALTELDAVHLYYMHKNPSIGKLTLLPFFSRGSRFYDRNLDFGEVGKSMFGELGEPKTAQPYLIGYDMEEVFGALDPEDAPKSQSSKDIAKFVRKAFRAYEKRTLTPEELEKIQTAGLTHRDKDVMRHEKTRLIDLDDINNCDVLNFEFRTYYQQGFADTFDKPFFVNSKDNTRLVDGKEYLPTLAAELDGDMPDGKRVIGRCENISSEQDIAAFMEKNGYEKAVIKPCRGMHGAGIFTVAKDEEGKQFMCLISGGKITIWRENET